MISLLDLPVPRLPVGEHLTVVVQDEDGNEVAGDAGVNLAMLDAGGSLAIAISPWQGQQAGDLLWLYWGEQPAIAQVLNDVDVGNAVHVSLPAHYLSDGQVSAYYALWQPTRGWQFSASIRVLVKLSRPGQSVPGELSQLASPTVNVEQVTPSNINGVQLGIEAYPGMRVRDRVEVDWGGQRFSQVLDPGQVGADLSLRVPAAVIRAAGDGDRVDPAPTSHVLVQYRVIDELLNSSEGEQKSPWSARLNIAVRLNGDPLPAVCVTIRGEGGGGSGCRAQVGGFNERDLLVEVYTYDYHFRVGDSLALHFDGFAFNGEPVPFHAELPVTLVPGPVTFTVANALARTLGRGTAAISYQRLRQGQPDLPSPQVPVIFTDPRTPLSLPKVTQASEDNYLPPDSPATVQIPFFPWIRAGQTLRIIWTGKRFDSGRVFYEQLLSIDEEDLEEGSDFIERTVPEHYVTQLWGQRAEVYYLVNAERSPSLFLQIGDALALLEAPEVQEAQGGMLAPGDIGEDGATLLIPAGEDVVPGSWVTYFWHGFDEQGFASERKQVETTEQPPVFKVAREIVLASQGQHIHVSYTVSNTARPGRVSHALNLTVGELDLDLPPPVVPAAPEAVLDPIDAINGLLVWVAYEGMNDEQQITVEWQDELSGESWLSLPKQGSATGEVDFDVPAAVIGSSIRPQPSPVVIRYTVSVGAEAPRFSLPLELSVESLAQLSPTQVLEANEGGLDLSDFDEDAHFLVTPWSFIALGQWAWLRLQGSSEEGPINQTLFEGALDDPEQLTDGVNLAIARALLLQLTSGSELTLQFKVCFDGSALEVNALTFAPLRLIINPLGWQPFEVNGWVTGRFAPVSGFVGARFKRKPIGLLPPIRFSVSHPDLASVDESGEVTLLGPLQQSLFISADGDDGRHASYRLDAPLKWYEKPSRLLYTFTSAQGYCLREGLQMPTIGEVIHREGQRGLGQLWSEWGDLRELGWLQDDEGNWPGSTIVFLGSPPQPDYAYSLSIGVGRIFAIAHGNMVYATGYRLTTLACRACNPSHASREYEGGRPPGAS
ncbi:hypothetical protein [Pseudomonas rubra]|uniref:Uncharacterized protein n=1 Tax=Pseudomonas rubra TaxID=2942627 RepID=A0ABT5PDT1_9PSED|nr:hypothetical protein [Pseudomonas rubra]MDD1016341.1 hypothetical protein [Pseudomonas rubra]MDD1037082.1 hypothetical protein [Pseudomonas rubra]MDD1153743.1 hypothetical protein [Pseudomonas rubra]